MAELEISEVVKPEGDPAVADTPDPEPETTPEKVEDPLEGLLVGESETLDPEPIPEAPVKRKRGRPAKSATPKKDETPTKKSEETKPDSETEPEVVQASEEEIKAEVAPAKPKDIYITADTQIFNGVPYRRGQKITFTVGDRFYNSQYDRDGKNWLDFVDDLDAQFAYFGRVVVEPNHWSGIPIGSTEGISHPGIALALAKIAQEEYERNGTPYN